MRLLIVYTNVPDGISLIITCSRAVLYCNVCWLFLSFMLIFLISWKLQFHFQWNLLQMFSICAKCRFWHSRGQGQSSRSKLPYWKSSNLPIARLRFKICTLNVVITDINIMTIRSNFVSHGMKLTFDRIQDDVLAEVFTLWMLSGYISFSCKNIHVDYYYMCNSHLWFNIFNHGALPNILHYITLHFYVTREWRCMLQDCEWTYISIICRLFSRYFWYKVVFLSIAVLETLFLYRIAYWSMAVFATLLPIFFSIARAIAVLF